LTIYKFKSRAAGDLIMLEPNGRQILSLIGKFDNDAPHQGILLPHAMPQAIAALEAAIVREEEQLALQTKQAQEQSSPAPKPQGISLRQRAVPFIAMLKRCHQADKEIVWGV
jgi:hypothetical protein